MTRWVLLPTIGTSGSHGPRRKEDDDDARSDEPRPLV